MNQKAEENDDAPILEKIDVQFTPKWPVNTTVPLLHANYFAFARTANETVLTFGEFLPYLQKPTDENIQEQLEKSSINVISRVAMSHAGFDALYSMLKRTMENEENQSDVSPITD